MNQLLYEGRFLVSTAGALIRQDDLRIVHSRMDWERVCRLADIHRISVILYLAILGSWEPIPVKCKERLFERYITSLCYNEIFDESVNEILTVLDMNQISCVVLDQGRVREYYPSSEMAGLNPLRLYISEGDYTRIKGYLVDLGYETKEHFKNAGERMARSGSIQVELFYRFPFLISWYRKAAEGLLEWNEAVGSFQYIRQMTEEGNFILRMAEASYSLSVGVLPLQKMIDLYLIHRNLKEHLNEEMVIKKLEDFHIEELSLQILELSYSWFGKRDEAYVRILEHTDAYEALEKWILTRETLPDSQLLPQAEELAGEVEQEIRRETKEEERRLKKEKFQKWLLRWKKRLSWFFPGRSYMKSIYPILENAPILLPVFWGIRGGRLLLSRKKGEDKER